MQHDKGFRFGIEAEYLLVDENSFRPLGQRDLAFATLNALLESIAVDDLPTVTGLLPQPPHRRVMPYVVEGYHLPDPDAAQAELLPKGIEIRTPVCGTIETATDVLVELHARVQQRLGESGWRAVAISHHPYEDHFEGPRGGRSEAVWRWAMQAMRTFGPDVNVGLPMHLFARLDQADLFAKIAYYAPAMTVLSLAAPLHRGGLWRHEGRVGKSLRTFRRSAVGEALELHPEQPGRLEFKCFDMSPHAPDFSAYLSLWLAVLLDDGLRGRGNAATRIRELQLASIEGLQSDALCERAAELLQRAEVTLASWNFDPATLAPLHDRVRRRRLLADDIIGWVERGDSVEIVLRRLTSFGSPESLDGVHGTSDAGGTEAVDSDAASSCESHREVDA